jgi:hypothetical protein
MAKIVPLIGRADRQFLSKPWRHTDFDKKYKFLTRSARLKKRMAVWDNALLPLLGENQKTFVELNRYAVGSCTCIGVGPRLVSCECNVLPVSDCSDESEDSDLRPAGL